jgi:ATP-dependent RNA helicase RhlE
VHRRYSSSPRRASSYKTQSFHGGGRGRNKNRFQRSGNTIPRERFIHQAEPIVTPEEEDITHSFADFNFHPELAKNIEEKGYDTPTPIQDKTIKPLLEGKDVIGLASTGTGKTAAFVLPIIHQLLGNKRRNTVLIITPTRELAHQVSDEFRSFARGNGLFSVVCVGGENIGRQKAELRRGVQVIIGTPGRLKDLLKQGELKLGEIKTLVLDEADQMLDMGFLPDVQFIMQAMPGSRQVVCFSATMTPAVARLLSGIQENAMTISTTPKVTSAHIDQNIIAANTTEEKMDHILTLLERPEYEKVLIFGETKRGVQRLADNLQKRGHKTQAIHGNKSQAQRQRALKYFKQNDASVMVATDVAARGLDIPNVHLVINFDQPNTYDTYVHRIGRTGRAGKTGTARTFVTA